jgi:hypothetical protein
MSVTGSASSTNLNVLRGKIRNLSPYALDPTLSIEGSAADAKAVGDALEKKVDRTLIADNLSTNDPEMVLSAKQGVEIKKTVENLRLETDKSISNIGQDISNIQTDVSGAKNSANVAHTAAKAAQTSADSKLAPDGTIAMSADFDMGGNRIVNVSDPEKEDDAANKKYVDACSVSKTFSTEVTLSKSNWASTSGDAPYTQSVDVAEILSADKPHYSVVYSDGIETAKAEKEAFALVDDLDTEPGKVTFTCFDERPEVDLTIQLEVNR